MNQIPDLTQQSSFDMTQQQAPQDLMHATSVVQNHIAGDQDRVQSSLASLNPNDPQYLTKVGSHLTAMSNLDQASNLVDLHAQKTTGQLPSYEKPSKFETKTNGMAEPTQGLQPMGRPAEVAAPDAPVSNLMAPMGQPNTDMPQYGGVGKPVAPGTPVMGRQFAMGRIPILEQQRLEAAGAGTPEGRLQADNLMLSEEAMKNAGRSGVGKFFHALEPTVIKDRNRYQANQDIAEQSKTGLEQAQAEAARLAIPKGTPEERDLNYLTATVNPDTGKTYTPDEAFQHIEQAKQAAKGDQTKQPVGDAGVTQHLQEIKAMENGIGMDPRQAQDFETAFGVRSTDTGAVATKRMEDAKAALQMTGAERDRAFARAASDRNHQDSEADRAIARDATAANREQTRAQWEAMNNPTTGNNVFGEPVAPMQGGLKEQNKREDAFVASPQYKSLLTLRQANDQFNHGLAAVNKGDFNGAQSVVTLFDAVGISATPLAGKGFRINQATVEEHKDARGLGDQLYAKLLKLKAGDVITPTQVREYAYIAAQTYIDTTVNTFNDAKSRGLNGDFVLPRGNNQPIDTTTASIFFKLSGGDKAKAIAAAKQLGWVF